MTNHAQSKAADQRLAAAIAAHQAGQRPEAETLYRQTLALRPLDAQALYLLGALYYEMKKLSEASSHLERALALQPGHAPAKSLLGVVYSLRGDTEKALPILQSVAAAEPHSAAAHYNVACALLELKRYGDAAAAFQNTLDLQPGHAVAMRSLAACYKELGRTDETMTLLRDCVARFPEYADAQVDLGRLLLERKEDAAASDVLQACLARHPNTVDALLLLGNLRYRQVRPEEAEPLLRRLVELVPGSAVANNYLGAVLRNLNRLDEAEEKIRKAFALAPEDPEVLTNLGLILESRGRSAEAATYHRRAVTVNPNLAEAWNNLGIALQHSGQWSDVLNCYERAITLKPEFNGAKTNKAHALLAQGRLSEAWAIYRYRFDQKYQSSKHRDFPYPLWTGAPDPKAKLLLWTDQGLGDEVLYMSMIREAQARVGHCILECAQRMVPLFQRSFPDATVLPRTTPPDPRIAELKPDFQLSLIELGEFLRPTIASIPQHRGYLQASPEQRAALRGKYEGLAQGRRIVGISWKSESPRTGVFKTMPLDQWGPILKTPGVFFVSLQYGKAAAELEAAKAALGVDVYQDPEVDPLQNPDGSASQIAAMDLVITTSNTTAHFAGGLGVPVWTLLPNGTGLLWYWFLGRSDSPWYPSMTLFRQTTFGDWSDVVANISARLRAQVTP